MYVCAIWLPLQIGSLFLSPCKTHVTEAFWNGGCVVVGRPHPSHPLKELHSTVYETTRATRKKDFDG